MLALLALLPAHALAARAGEAIWQHPSDATSVLAYDATTEDRATVDPVPPDADPVTPADPVPVEPAEPVPSDPAPAPSEPAPAPSDPAPPADPAPTEPAPAPSDPAPSEPVAPAEDPAPPADPAPRDDRAPAPKPPADEHQVLSDATAPMPVSAPEPVADAPSDPAGTAPARVPGPASADAGDASQAKAVRAALRRLGIGTIAAPAAVEDDAPAAVAAACTPIGTVDAGATSETGDGVASQPVVRSHRSGDEPPLVRGPPAPLESPSSPFAVAGSGSAAPGGVSGDRDCGILADQIAFALDDDGDAVAFDCCDYVAPAPANAAARAPPVA